MKESHSEELHEFLNEYRSINQNQYNIIDILDILDKDFDLGEKNNFSLYLSRRVYEEWKRFCKVHPCLSISNLTDKAFIYAMLTIPNKNALVQIEIPEKLIEQQSLSDKMIEIINLPELEQWIETTNITIKQNGGIHPNKIKRLHDIIKECSKIKNRSDKLDLLLKEAISRVE